eukprot:934955-Rhodomonas_salina.1
MSESQRRRSPPRCRWRAPAGRLRRPPSRPEFRWQWPSQPNPCSPAFCSLQCAVSRSAQSFAAAAPGRT